MDVFIIIIVVLIILVSAAIVIRYLMKQKKRTNHMIRDNEHYIKRQESAIWATALVIHSEGGALPVPSSKLPVALTMEITPADGKPYRAKTQWLVDISALGYVAEGQQLSVKIDKDDMRIIYPSAPWAKYIAA